MRVLFVLDPLEKLKLTWDSSIYLLRELNRRGHKTWIADAPDIHVQSNEYYAQARLGVPQNLSNGSWDPDDDYALETGGVEIKNLEEFDVILIRKEPPFDDTYLYMTHLLERVADKVPVFNHPRGIRNTNEKLGILKFPQWIPETLVTSSIEKILEFANNLQSDLVIKPLELKGGQGVFQLDYDGGDIKEASLEESTQEGTRIVMAQKFIPSKKVVGDKRLLIFNGKLWAAYERHAPDDDFRSNVAVGGTYHPTEVNDREKQIAEDVGAYLLKEGIQLAGLDVLEGYLIEVNVTCSAGLCEAKMLYPDLPLVEQWADHLESLPQKS